MSRLDRKCWSGFVSAAVLALIVPVAGGAPRPPPERVVAPSEPAGAESLDSRLLDYYVTQQTGRPASEVAESQRAALHLELQQLQGAAARPAGSDAPLEVELARLRILARSAAEAAGVYAEPGEQEIESAYAALCQLRATTGRPDSAGGGRMSGC